MVDSCRIQPYYHYFYRTQSTYAHFRPEKNQQISNKMKFWKQSSVAPLKSVLAEELDLLWKLVWDERAAQQNSKSL